MLCLYVFEDVIKEIKFIEMIFSLKYCYLIKLIRRGIMWVNLIILKEKLSELKYKYKIKMKKLGVYFFSFLNEVVEYDEYERIICWGYV